MDDRPELRNVYVQLYEANGVPVGKQETLKPAAAASRLEELQQSHLVLFQRLHKDLCFAVFPVGTTGWEYFRGLSGFREYPAAGSAEPRLPGSGVVAVSVEAPAVRQQCQ
ncbi:hypothetical protein H4R18_005414 [Coemansia javaensis]|uniref:Uncharacterized protein n=1 Tax=Coemansia javaensis TaxID=2761396 RepID=A0A9W8H2L9_9FUNG|nr:hypothetical protein H4R18_005414 [Coemansia javaensis]